MAPPLPHDDVEALEDYEIITRAASWTGNTADLKLFASRVAKAYNDGELKFVQYVLEILLYDRFAKYEERMPPLQLGLLRSYMALIDEDNDSEAWVDVAKGSFDEARDLCAAAGVSAAEVDRCQAAMQELYRNRVSARSEDTAML